MPGVGDNGFRFEFLPFGRRIAINRFFHDNGYQRAPEGDLAGRGEILALEPGGKLAGTADDDADGRGGQGQADEQRGDRLEFAVAEIVRTVLRPGADADEGEDHDVGHEVGDRMDGVGHHRTGMPGDAGGEFEADQQQIGDSANHRDLIDFLFPRHFAASSMVVRCICVTTERSTTLGFCAPAIQAKAITVMEINIFFIGLDYETKYTLLFGKMLTLQL